MQTMVHFGKEVEINLIQLRKFSRQYKVEEWAQKCGFRIFVEKTGNMFHKEEKCSH